MLFYKVKTQYVHFRLHINYTFFYLEKFLKKLADNQCPTITKGSIYHIKHMSIQPFTKLVEGPDIELSIEVPTIMIMFDI